MTRMMTVDSLHGEALRQAADHAVRSIPPAWPLAATVAVNPFLGQSDETFQQTSARFARIAGTRLALPRQHYAKKLAQGEIVNEDLVAALRSAQAPRHIDLKRIKASLTEDARPVAALPTIADLAARATGRDWPAFIAERIGTFAGSFFDQGQALWTPPRRTGIYAAWRAFATHDLTPEIIGLKGFSVHVADAPASPQAAIERASVSLGLAAAPGTYFHQLLLTLGGWAQYARQIQFTAELDGKSDDTALELLAVRLVFEEALFACHRREIEADWQRVRRAHAEPLTVDDDTKIDGILQAAAERAAQRRLAEAFQPSPAVKATNNRPVLQAAFCIDVRSEVFRRALESIDPGIRTLGFAGFFGLKLEHRSFASDDPEHRLPVLMKPSLFSCTAVTGEDKADQQVRFRARAVRAWGRFKLAAVSSFAFVEATGVTYGAKLLLDSLGFAQRKDRDNKAPSWSSELDLETRTNIAETVLRAMSLTQGFGRFVLLAGHGATVNNNPYASTLHCGACGGYAGDVNARLLAKLLNDPAVREELAVRNLAIPSDTVFLGGLHDTTTDSLTVFEEDLEIETIAADLAVIRPWLAQAGMLARAERASRLPQATAQTIAQRGSDWAQVRPELGLAGCRAFIAAPRSRTAGRSLAGQAFLHDYVWTQDEGFKILELILTAPVVVASWINLQYFGSTVAPSLFGAGNKLLHNVVGGIGVFEGNGGAMRAGLPWQSVHDGSNYLHEPLRLTVAVEAPKEAIADILKRHPQVRALFDNEWLHLFVLNEQGQMAWRYTADQGWVPQSDMRASA